MLTITTPWLSHNPTIGMAMGRVFRVSVPPLMGHGSILINGFENFFKTRGGFGYCPVPPRPVPIIFKI